MGRFARTLLVLGLVGLVACQPPPDPNATVHTGTTIGDAAPSCWAIKQSFPASADGIYWLLTPQLAAPQQFYCDMTTDGGGWVLVGRGRDGWSFAYDGQSTASQVRSVPSGTTAFAPAALPTKTIDGLLGGGRVDSLFDGIRIARAANNTGTAWQELRWRLHSQAGWTWAFGGGALLDSIDIDGTNYSMAGSNAVAGSTADVAIDDGMLRVFTWPWDVHNKEAGFAYGASVAGSSTATSYLWTYSSENYALPFAQVWLRPTITDASAGFTMIPSNGVAASAQRPLPSNNPKPTPWGVTGLLTTAEPDPGNDSPVLAFAQIGTTMYVGGRFQNVQQGSAGTPTVQSFLAAFDAKTGNWISTFRPVLDGLVYDLVASPDGKLIVGGNFTSINGVANTAGVAKIDPATGAPITTWHAVLQIRRFQGSRPYAHALDLRGNWLYVVGSFSRVAGGPTAATRVAAGGVARVAIADGTPDAAWHASLDNTPIDVSSSPDGTRVYIVGRFTTIGGVASRGVAVVDAVTAALVPGLKSWVPNDATVSTQYMQVSLDTGTNVAIGGSQHSLQLYARSDFTLLRAHTTRYSGDYQAMALSGGVLFASCHCVYWDYADNNTYPVDAAYSRVAPIRWVGAYDPNTLDQIEEFQPQVSMSTQGEGPWELFTDSSSCLWIGGDIVATLPGRWAGGFARVCQRDATAPTTPTAFKLVGASTLQWNASTDNSGAAPSYEVLRNDRVVATSTTTSFATSGSGRYFVRAVDAAGNRSATTAVLVV